MGKCPKTAPVPGTKTGVKVGPAVGPSQIPVADFIAADGDVVLVKRSRAKMNEYAKKWRARKKAEREADKAELERLRAQVKGDA
jgi:hypothetical protein